MLFLLQTPVGDLIKKDYTVDEKLSVEKLSYIPPSLFLVAGLILLFLDGLKPYEAWYAKTYRWIAVPATFQKGSIVTVPGPKSLVAKNTGSRFKIKFVLRYEPRKLYDTAYFDQEFPEWLRLPAQSFLWTETAETYDSPLETSKALFALQNQKIFTLYMDPENPRKARLHTWNKWLFIQIGAALTALALLWFGFIFIVNTRRTIIAQRKYQEELWRQQNIRRHHNKGQKTPSTASR